MDWLKNFLQAFKNDSSDNEDFLKNNQEHLLKEENNSESLKDMNTKIVYQYPKSSGHSTFLSQEAVQKPNRSIRDGSKQKYLTELTGEKFDKQSSRTESRPKAKPSKKTISEERKNQKVREKPAQKRNGPFRPTEIPSPIYGFERPEDTEIIEYELTGFLQEEDLANRLINKVSIHQEELDLVQEVFEETAVTAEIHEQIVEKLIDEPIVCTSESDTYEQFEVISNHTDNDVLESTVTNEDENLEDFNETFEDSVLEEHSLVQETPKDEETVFKRNEENRTIPFNVLMLKQDWEKWEKNKLKTEIKENETLNHEIEPEANNQTSSNHYEPRNDMNKRPQESKDTLNPVVDSEQGDVFSTQELVNYQFPSKALLTPPAEYEENVDWLEAQEEILNQTLANFNVGAKVVHVTQGPSVTRFEVQPDPGVKVNKITNLQDDIKLSMAARDIRIEAPIPGKQMIGIEVPNEKSRPVLISEILCDPVFSDHPSPMTAVLGLDISGKPIVTDLRKMPHGLIAGATGSGKSVCINSILTSLLYKAKPQDVKMLLIDPKMVELAPYNHIPHLVSPVITDVKAATVALKWAVAEMERRYELFAHTGVREITRFNEKAEKAKQYSEKLPYILIVIDELADLMMVAPADVEEAVCRIAQKARACGIHLIIATQRPSVDVITGLIKANIPTRVAFSVSSQVDSRTIIDMSGAEKLLGRGDMLFLENGTSKPVRLQGTYISDIEIDKVVEHARNQESPNYVFEQNELLKKAEVDDEDELFYEACEFILEQGGASTSSLQRKFKIGYNRAARLIDLMEQNGFISESRGSKPRDVLITEDDLDKIIDTSIQNK